jgi:hypothetical protein
LVVQRIRALRAAGINPSQAFVVKEYPALYGAAQRMLGGWRKALITSGEDPAEVARASRTAAATAKTRWTNALVLDALRDRQSRGEALDVTAMRKDGFSSLIKASRDLFGTYENALGELGIAYNSVRLIGDWNSQDKVLAGIRDLAESGSDLNVSAAQHRNSSLVTAAIRVFGSWDKALLAADHDPAGVRLDVNTEAYKGRIFQNLCYELFAALRPSWRSDFRLRTREGLLLPDAYDPSTEEWIDFKIAAWGMSVDKSIRKYRRHAQSLRFIHLGKSRKCQEGIVFESVFSYQHEVCDERSRKLFDELRLLAATDVPSTHFDEWARIWTRKEVIDGIQELPATDRNSRAAQVRHKRLYAAAVRFFGGWYPATAAAGLRIEEIRRKRETYTREDVTAFIVDRMSRQKPLSAKAVTKTSSGSGLYQAATRLFGGWKEALESSGVGYDSAKEKLGREKVTRQLLDEFIRSRFSAGQALNALTIRDGFKGQYGAAFRIHGGWRQAVEACGIAYRDVCRQAPPVNLKKTDIDKYIRARFDQGLALNTHAVCLDNRPIHTAACRRVYGSWRAALEANGIRPDSVALRVPRRKG